MSCAKKQAHNVLGIKQTQKLQAKSFSALSHGGEGTPFLTFHLASTECISLHPIYQTNEIVSFLIYHITSNTSKKCSGLLSDLEGNNCCTLSSSMPGLIKT